MQKEIMTKARLALKRLSPGALDAEYTSILEQFLLDVQADMAARRFPIQNQGYPGVPDSIPWSWIEPFNGQAERNHSQTLVRLAQRGGLAPCEALAIVQNRKYVLLAREQASAAWLAWIKTHEK